MSHFPDEPTSIDELQHWLRDELEVEAPHEGMLDDHAAPLAYLAHAFFEGKVPEEPAAPPDCVLWACRGGGKTFLGAVATVLDMVYKGGIQIRILGGSLDQSRRMHEHLRALFERPWLAEMVDGKITDRRIRLVSGSQVELLAQSETSVRGVRVQKLRCDEVELFKPEIWAAVQLTTRKESRGGKTVPGVIECLSTMHRPYGVMREVVAEALGGTRALFKWGVLDVLEKCGEEFACEGEGGDCPLLAECQKRAKRADHIGGHFSVEDAIRMKQRVSLTVWRSEMLCERPSTSDNVLPEFDVNVHVKEAPADQEGWDYVGGMDFGYRAPAVVLWAGLDPEGTLWVLSERSERGKLLGEHIDAIHRRLPKLSWIGVDPAGGQTNSQTGKADIEQMRAAGFQVRSRRSAISEGLELIRARLKPGSGPARLYVSAQCEALVRSMETYHYDEGQPDSETPLKDGADHAVDALRYLVLNLDRPYRSAHARYTG